MTSVFELESVDRMSRKIGQQAALLDQDEARFLVALYYEMQEQRIRLTLRLSRRTEQADPVEGEVRVSDFFLNQFDVFERNAQRALGIYAASQFPVGPWLQSITGIGPVLSAGVLSFLPPAECGEVVGHWWRFAGLDPTQVWEKGQKRPFNARLKTLCWKIGESFVKVSGNPNDYYGKVYKYRRELEDARNDAGEYAEQAANILATRKFGEDTIARGFYEQGKLPPAHIYARSKRYAVKMFLSHYHYVCYESINNRQPPKPYVLDHVPGHNDFIAPPNWPLAE